MIIENSVPNHTKLQRICLILSSTALIGLTTIIIYIPLAKNYETSIYSGYPPVFWLFFFLSLLPPTLYLIFSSEDKINNWQYSLLLVFCTYALLFFLPVFKGYALYGRGSADVLGHLGEVKIILETKHISEGNFYPIIHIMIAELHYLVGLSLNILSSLISAIFTFTYITFIFLYARELTSSRNKSLTVLACSVPLLFSTFHLTTHPAALSFMSIPLFLFLYEKQKIITNSQNTTLLLVIISFFIVFFHPVTALILFVIMMTSFMAVTMFRRHEMKNICGCVTLIPIILTISFGMWYFSFSGGLRALSKIVNALFGKSQLTIVEHYFSGLATSGLTFSQTIVRFIELYGPIIIYAILALIASFFIFKRFLKKKATFSELHVMLQFIVGTITGSLFLILYLIEFNPLRVSRYMIMMATILVGIFVSNRTHHIFSKNSNFKLNLRNSLIILLILLVLLSAILSIKGVYKPNYHLTYAELYGTRWFLDSYDSGIDCVSFGMSHKMTMFIKGAFEGGGKRVFQANNERLQIPKHIGYDKNSSIGQTFTGSIIYLITKAHDLEYYRIYYPNQWDYLDYYTQEDINRLEEDKMAYKLYSNGNYKVWLVKGNGFKNE